MTNKRTYTDSDCFNSQRLSALGFAHSLDLSTEASRNRHPTHHPSSLPLSSNYGLIDQHNAFLWIQSHIQSFGGDPSNITAFGISAGSASIHYHILSGSPLFDRAICMSGVAPVLGPLPDGIFEKAWGELCASFEVGDKALSARCEVLRSKEPLDVIKRYTRAPMGPMLDGIYLPWRYDVFSPQVEGRCKSLILGDTKDDGIIVDYISQHIPQSILLGLLQPIFSSVEDFDSFLSWFEIRKEEMEGEKYKLACRRLFSVLLFQYTNFCVARGFKGKVFMYHFDHKDEGEGGRETRGLAYHGMCARYMWQNDNANLSEEHRKSAEEMGRLWTGFGSGKVGSPWEEFGKRERFMRFGGQDGKDVVVGVDDDGERDHGYMEWLDSHQEECKKLFVLAMELVECKLLRQWEG